MGVLRAFVRAGLMIVGVSTLLFLAVDLMPGDITDDPSLSDQARSAIRAQYRLDEPLPVRFTTWMSNASRLDFGTSYASGRSVRGEIAARLGPTLLLSGSALILAFGIGIGVGAFQARHRDGPLDHVLSGVTLFLFSMPSFWLGLVLMWTLALMAQQAGWPIAFPISGMTSVDYAQMSPVGRLADVLHHLALPLLTLTLVSLGGAARLVRSEMRGALASEYTRTARAQGVAEGRIVYRYALKNALLPVAAQLGLALPVLFSGAVLVESVFAWPGMGLLMFQSIGRRDMPVIMALGLMFSVLVVVGSLLADGLARLVDPRVRRG